MTSEDLAARGLRVKAEMLAKEMQMIVAADRWKGRALDAAPPEKWHRLRPETQQFWIDEATRILKRLDDEEYRQKVAQMKEDFPNGI